MSPLVGISAWRRELETVYGPETMQTVSAYYTDAVTSAGMTPILYPSALDPDEAGRLVAMVDGVLLSGGDDVDPGSYGAENTRSRNTSVPADRFEIALAHAAREQRKPLLAICRGLQVLNVALGGTLRQEVTSAGGVHEPISRDGDEMEARRHVVRFETGSIIAGAYGSSEVKLNTLHHQGVGELADSLLVEGRTDDGLVEAARYEGDWWALGVQWHPERMDGDHLKVFDLLRAAIEAS